MGKIGYARVSGKDQNLSRQIKALEDEQVSKIFADKLTGFNLERPQLHEMLNFIREGDIVVVVELDRLGRNNFELTETMNKIKDKGSTLEILNLPSMKGIEDENLRLLINNLIIEIYKYQAESDRKRILERQKQGIEIAKDLGKYKGKPFKYKQDDERLLHAFSLYEEGNSDQQVAKLTGINERTFRRYRQRNGIYRSKKND